MRQSILAMVAVAALSGGTSGCDDAQAAGADPVLRSADAPIILRWRENHCREAPGNLTYWRNRIASDHEDLNGAEHALEVAFARHARSVQCYTRACIRNERHLAEEINHARSRVAQITRYIEAHEKKVAEAEAELSYCRQRK